MSQATSIHHELQERGKSAFAKYKYLTVGKKGTLFLIKYELITSLFGSFPGIAGYFFRRIFYKHLLKAQGKGVIWGKNVTLRHPDKIEIGEGVAINDLAVLDAYGREGGGIVIGQLSLISRNTVLNSKGGFIEIGKNTNIGINSTVYARDCRVKIGNNVLIAAYTYLMGGGDHQMERTDIPIASQGAECRGIEIGDNVWLGAGTKVRDGCKIGKDCVIGTNSYVNSDIPEYSIAVGIPAKVIKKRKQKYP